MMRSFVVTVTITIMVLTAVSARAAETTVGGEVYPYWMMDVTDGAGNYNVFALGRAYVSVKSKLSEYTSVRVTTDLRETDAFDGYSVILKYAYLDWKPEFGKGVATFRFGLQPTHYIDLMNKLWNRRYLEKTVGDLQGLLTSADLGAGLMFNLGEKGKTGFIAVNVWNGTSYSRVEERNKQKDFSGFIRLTPLADNPDFKRTALQAQAYVGTQNVFIPDTAAASDYDHTVFSVGGLLGYRNTFDIGFDVNFNSEGQGVGADDVKATGHSVFATLYFEDFVADECPLRTVNLFGRADMYDPNTDAEDDGETLIIGGVECAPVKGFKASVNVRSLSYQAEGVDSETYVYFNTLLAF